MKHSLGNLSQASMGRAYVFLAALLCAGGLLILFQWDPATTAIYPSCPWRTMTGIYCPGCGSLRATHRLLHGQLADAFRLNPLMVLSLPLLGYAVLSTRWPRLRPPWLERFTARPAWPWILLAILLTYWVVRNLPFEPFVWLAPQQMPPL
jgi:hypothetical protein